MTTLDDFARVLGGVIRVTGSQRWLETRIGGLRAAVICRRTPLSGTIVYDLAVITPSTREQDPLHRYFDRPESASEWRLGDDGLIPVLRNGYVFAGCRRGVLFASSLAEPALEDVIGALWELATWARGPWRPLGPDDAAEQAREQAAERRRRWRQRVERLAVVATVVVVAAIVRRSPSLAC